VLSVGGLPTTDPNYYFFCPPFHGLPGSALSSPRWIVGSFVVPFLPELTFLGGFWSLELGTALVAYVFLWFATTFLKVGVMGLWNSTVLYA